MPLREEEIRPAQMFSDYLALAAKDALTMFADVPRRRIACPACTGDEVTPRFDKLGFRYVECVRCGTLFVSPRPQTEAFAAYYRDSESARFWASDFYRQTEEARREKLVRPKARRVLAGLDNWLAGIPPAAVVDIGAGYGVFCEEIRGLAPDLPIVAVEPGPALAQVCRNKGLSVIESFVEDLDSALLPPGPKLVTCFELLEHVHDPIRFCGHLARLLDGGVLVLTTLSGFGFDVQALGERSKAVHPPYHINFFNPASIETLLVRAGLRPILVETPGELDVDIVRKQPDDVSNPFLRRIATAGDDTRQRFQQFLRESGLSSHMWAIAAAR